MTKEPTLIIMAAGMGSRYGGLKQIEKMTDTGEIILDFSLYDAMMAGFKRVIFVIREEHRDIFRELVDERAGKYLTVEYAYQKLTDIHEGESVPEGREKPWGTGHAIYACRHLIDGPFAVINADDYYGATGFASIYDYLTQHSQEGQPVMELCMAGYLLRNTITENGHVARGVCETDEKGYLTSITERTKIMRRPEGIAFALPAAEAAASGDPDAGRAADENGDVWTVLPEDTLVSMNFWGLSGEMMEAVETGLASFFTDTVPGNPLKSEYMLPSIIDGMIRSGRARVRVIPCREKWCGVTYKEDKEEVRAELQSKKDKGFYPDRFWK